MSTPSPIVSSSLRKHPQLQGLFKAAESRQLSTTELKQYNEIVPDHAVRAKAAAEVAKVESAVVQKTVKEIFVLYPYEQVHDRAPEKCIRDVTYVSAYATQTMLMNDPQWFEDKLLLWLKTILQAFSFPTRSDKVKKSMFGLRSVETLDDITSVADTLPTHIGSIYATYTRLKQNYKQVLSPEAFALMDGPLQQAIDILSSK